MKTKKFNKLSLNKQTVASLNTIEMSAVNGGATDTCPASMNMLCIKTIQANCFILVPKTWTIKWPTTRPTNPPEPTDPWNIGQEINTGR